MRLLLLLLLLLTILSRPILAENLLLVDTSRALIQVRDGSRVLLEIPNIAIGRAGTSTQRKKGDATTPIGRYRINEIRASNHFYKFIGLDYPSVADARLGRESGSLQANESLAIEKASRLGKLPPQNTGLGGLIGLHGVGHADPSIHASTNWTKGCIAMTDQQIDRLLPLIRIGTTVEIR